MAETWSGRAGFILATIGSAIGLGSIWKFPYEVGQNGGGAFVLFYLLGLALVVLPLVLAEFALGRRGGSDAPASILAVAGQGAGWRWIGWMSGAGQGCWFSRRSKRRRSCCGWCMRWSRRCCRSVLRRRRRSSGHT